MSYPWPQEEERRWLSSSPHQAWSQAQTVMLPIMPPAQSEETRISYGPFVLTSNLAPARAGGQQGATRRRQVVQSMSHMTPL